MKKINPLLGKILYALLFNALFPLLLFVWAKMTGPVVKLQAIESLPWGAALMITGFVLMVWGMLALMKFGQGLPMNAYPPKNLVDAGPFQLFRHPIYWGFGILVCGTSVLTGSASGLWMVTPVTVLGMTALVWGYERLWLRQRFPDKRIKTYLDIGGTEPEPAVWRDRISAIFWILFLLLAGNFVVGYLTGNAEPLTGKSWKIHTLLENDNIRFLSLLFVIGVPLTLRRQDRIREWAIKMVIGLGISIYLAVLWPSVGAQYLGSGYPDGDWAVRLGYLSASIPLFLVLLSLKAYAVEFKRIVILTSAAAVYLGLVQVVNCRSSSLHLLVSLTIFLVVDNYFLIWTNLKNFAERLANSWKEYRLGPVRIINHGLIVGFGAVFALMLTGLLVGREYAWACFVFAFTVIICAGLWAQLIEGSDKLKRPFGYYGALVGIMFASLFVWLMGRNVWVVVGVASVAMPWTQAIGRFRCIANGCCHGSPTHDDRLGIRYFHDRTRVCGLSGLKGKLIHPTPLYAIIWLFLVGFIQLALWQHHMPYSFIFGIYLILTGIGRFVEEAYRGEVQTPILDGLHLYQWTAIASILVGVGVTMIPVKVVEIHPVFGWEIVFTAFLGGFLTFFVMGVDFPRSNARFSRLV